MDPLPYRITAREIGIRTRFKSLNKAVIFEAMRFNQFIQVHKRNRALKQRRLAAPNFTLAVSRRLAPTRVKFWATRPPHTINIQLFIIENCLNYNRLGKYS